MAALKVRGHVRVPGDKSISHRALMLAALAEGESNIRGVLEAADVAATAYVLRGLGASIPPLSGDMHVGGCGVRGFHAPGSPLDCENSGTTARLVAGIVAGHPFSATFVGDESLTKRPMKRVAEPLTVMGARVETSNRGTLPMTVTGGDLRETTLTLDVRSAQVKSAILLAALNAGVRVTIRGDAGTRDHTERLLGFLGARVEVTGDEICFVEPGELDGFQLDVPGDPSSAAYLVALGALARSTDLTITNVCLNPRRIGFIEALQRMGAAVDAHVGDDSGPEPVGTVTVRSAEPSATDVTGFTVAQMIDELPLFACVAARADGQSTVTGAGELRVKESDRISAVVTNLRAIGADAEELPDGFTVRGSHKPLRGRVTTHGDHRIAMSFGVLAHLPGNEIEVDDRECVAISYPSFWDDLARIVS